MTLLWRIPPSRWTTSNQQPARRRVARNTRSAPSRSSASSSHPYRLAYWHTYFVRESLLLGYRQGLMAFKVTSGLRSKIGVRCLGQDGVRVGISKSLEHFGLTGPATVVLFIYLFSCLFVFGSWVFQLLFLAELRMDFVPCSAAGILCLTAYVVIKVSCKSSPSLVSLLNSSQAVSLLAVQASTPIVESWPI